MFWSVDHVTPGEEIHSSVEGRYLVRLNHLSHGAPGGLRYLLAEKQCVELRPYETGDDSPKITYGLTCSLDFAALQEASVEFNAGRGAYAMPLITAENLTTCLTRHPEVEAELRAEIGALLGEAPASEGLSSPGIEGGGGRGPTSSFKLHVVNVGQGDTLLLELSGGRLWFIDGYFWGRAKYNRFAQELTRVVPGYRVERVVVSHYHYDHIRSVPRIIDDFAPSEVLVTNTLVHSTGATRRLLRHAFDRGILRIIKGPLQTKFNGMTVEVLRTVDFPGNPRLGLDPNEHAICVLCRTKKSRVLLAADVPGKLLAGITGSKILGGRASYRLYKVTHHCSRTGDVPRFLKSFPAQDSVTSCGAQNRYGHPHDPPDAKLKSVGKHWKTFKDKRLILSFPFE